MKDLLCIIGFIFVFCTVYFIFIYGIIKYVKWLDNEYINKIAGSSSG